MRNHGAVGRVPSPGAALKTVDELWTARSLLQKPLSVEGRFTSPSGVIDTAGSSLAALGKSCPYLFGAVKILVETLAVRRDLDSLTLVALDDPGEKVAEGRKPNVVAHLGEVVEAPVVKSASMCSTQPLPHSKVRLWPREDRPP
jgi:hypothetical protein